MGVQMEKIGDGGGVEGIARIHQGVCDADKAADEDEAVGASNLLESCWRMTSCGYALPPSSPSSLPLPSLQSPPDTPTRLGLLPTPAENLRRRVSSRLNNSSRNARKLSIRQDVLPLCISEYEARMAARLGKVMKVV